MEQLLSVEASIIRSKIKLVREDCLILAGKVLSETNSTLTAKQIWDHASLKGYLHIILPNIENAMVMLEGTSPWRFLGYYLQLESNKPGGRFQRIPDVPNRYGLSSEVVGPLEQLWQVTHFRTKRAEKLGLRRLHKLIQRKKSPQPRFRLAAKKEPVRSPYVRAYVRLRADHCCELCGWAGFEEDDGSRYIEVHHLQWLVEGGSDTPENAAALCPNCHRELHFGKQRRTLLLQLRKQIAEASIQAQNSAK